MPWESSEKSTSVPSRCSSVVTSLNDITKELSKHGKTTGTEAVKLFLTAAQKHFNGDISPIGLYVGLGTRISGTQLEFTQGIAEETGRQLDILIDGEGLFQVEIEDDIGDGIGYTRAGNFIINEDGEVVLASQLFCTLDELPPLRGVVRWCRPEPEQSSERRS